MYKLLLTLVIIPGLVLCQTTKKITPVIPFSKDEITEGKREAASYFKSENYRTAKMFYERLVASDANDVDYNYKLALCYLNTNISKEKAIPLLEYVVNANSKDIPANAIYDLGRAYHYGGYFDKAKESFEKFRVAKKGVVDAKLKLEQWVSWSNNAIEMIASPIVATFENLGKGINSSGSDYKPVTSVNDSVVYFTSSRKGNTGGQVDELGDITSDIYYFIQGDSSRSKAKNAGMNINTLYYEECLSVNMSGDKMLIYMEGMEANGDIFITDLKGKQWNKAVSLGKAFVTKAMETGACLSPDGLTLYFSAEAEGSKTGKDIYRCTRTEQTTWSKPERLSDKINTKEDEDYPVIWVDGKTLFFSSKGHKGMGGYDIYKSVVNNPAEGFSAPENIGYPLNSTYDDQGIGLNADGKTLYLAAVRDSGYGEYDIYKVKLNESLVMNKMCHLSGVGLTALNAPAKGCIVTVNDAASGALIYTLTTNEASGKFDVALPTGSYKVALRHPKMGKVEEEVLINAVESSEITVFFTFK